MTINKITATILGAGLLGLAMLPETYQTITNTSLSFRKETKAPSPEIILKEIRKLKERTSIPSYGMTAYVNKYHQGLELRDDPIIITNDGTLFARIYCWNKDKTSMIMSDRYAKGFNFNTYIERLKARGISVKTILPNKK